MSAVVILSVNHLTITPPSGDMITADQGKQVIEISQMCSSRAWLGDAMDSKLSMQNQIIPRNAGKSQKILTSRRNSQDPCIRTMLWNLVKLAKSWIGTMRAAQIRNQWNCRTTWTTSERRHFVSVDSVWTARKAGGKTPWSVSAIFEMCKTY